MNVAELKKIIQNIPDEAEVVLVDISTDNPMERNYYLDHKQDIALQDVYTKTDDEFPTGKALIFTFYNNLNHD